MKLGKPKTCHCAGGSLYGLCVVLRHADTNTQGMTESSRHEPAWTDKHPCTEMAKSGDGLQQAGFLATNRHHTHFKRSRLCCASTKVVARPLMLVHEIIGGILVGTEMSRGFTQSLCCGSLVKARWCRSTICCRWKWN